MKAASFFQQQLHVLKLQTELNTQNLLVSMKYISFLRKNQIMRCHKISLLPGKKVGKMNSTDSVICVSGNGIHLACLRFLNLCNIVLKTFFGVNVFSCYMFLDFYLPSPVKAQGPAMIRDGYTWIDSNYKH